MAISIKHSVAKMLIETRLGMASPPDPRPTRTFFDPRQPTSIYIEQKVLRSHTAPIVEASPVQFMRSR